MKSAKCLQPLPGLITKDQIYTILYEMPTSYVIIDDRGEQCNYAISRFELLLAPQVPPDFRQMQQIADDVKITQCPVVEEFNERKPNTDPYPVIRVEGTKETVLPTSSEILADAMAVQKQAFESSLTDLLAAANRRNKQLEEDLAKLYDHNNELEEHVRILELEVDSLNERLHNLIEKTPDDDSN